MTRFSAPPAASSFVIAAMIASLAASVTGASSQTVGSNGDSPSSHLGNTHTPIPVVVSAGNDLRSLVMEYESARKAKELAIRTAPTSEARLRAQRELQALVAAFSGRFYEHARRNPTQPGSLQALVWVVENGGGNVVDNSTEIIAQYYVNRPELAPVLIQLADSPNPHPSVNGLFRRVMRQSGQKLIQGNACFGLAQRLLNIQGSHNQPVMVANLVQPTRIPAPIPVRIAPAPTPAVAPAPRSTANPPQTQIAARPVPAQTPAPTSANANDPRKEAATLLQKVVSEYADVPYARITDAMTSTQASGTVKTDRKFIQAKLGDEARKVLPRLASFAGAAPRDRSGSEPPLPIISKTGLHGEEDLAVGKIAPEIHAYSLTGQPMRLSQFRGRITILTFWGDWCSACRASLPYERILLQKFPEKISIVGVNSDRNPQQALARLATENSNFPSFYDGGSSQGPIAEQWGIQFWPTLYVLDHRGVIRYKGLLANQLEQAVSNLVGEIENGSDDRVALKKPN